MMVFADLMSSVRVVILFLWLSGISFIGFSSSALACDFDDFPMPTDMETYPILDNVVHNNRVIIARGYTTDLTKDRLQKFYTRQWDNRVLMNKFGPWDQIFTLRDDCLFTVQMGNGTDEGTQGRLVITPAPTGAIGAVGEGLMVPPDSQVVTDTVMDDGPKVGRFSTIVSGMHPAGVERFYKAALSTSGWRLQNDWSDRDRRVMVFKDGLTLMNIVVSASPDGGSNIVLNTEKVK